MLPTEQFSGDAVPQVPWTPPVWKYGPDALVANAQADLFGDHDHLTTSVLGGGDRAMSGSNTAPQNESDVVIGAGDSGGTGDRASGWNEIMSDLRRTEPLAAWSSGTYDGAVNPGAMADPNT